MDGRRTFGVHVFCWVGKVAEEKEKKEKNSEPILFPI